MSRASGTRFVPPFRAIVLAVSASLLLASCGLVREGGNEGQAAAQCEGYPQQDIDLIVPTSPGGGFDAWARMVAPAMEKYLSGDARVVVRNVPGAGTMEGTNQVFSAAPDGTTLLVNKFESIATNQILGKVHVNLTDFTWIGQLTVDPLVFFVNPASNVQTMDQLRQVAQTRPLKHATREASAIAAITYGLYGIQNYEPVLHEGSSEAVLSLIRGDTDVTWLSLGSTIEYVQGGQVKPILYLGENKPAPGQPGHGKFTNVQTGTDTGHPELDSTLAMRRAVAAPPKTPACISQVLERALQDALADPGLQEQARAANRVVIPAGADETARAAQATLDLYRTHQQAITSGLS